MQIGLIVQYAKTVHDSRPATPSPGMVYATYDFYLLIKYRYRIDIAIFWQYRIGIVSNSKKQYSCITNANNISYRSMVLIRLYVLIVVVYDGKCGHKISFSKGRCASDDENTGMLQIVQSKCFTINCAAMCVIVIWTVICRPRPHRRYDVTTANLLHVTYY